MKKTFIIFAVIITIIAAFFSKPKEPEFVVVKVTMYQPNPGQTDGTPYVTASGFRLNKRNPKKDRIIAISRDLREKLDFGDTVRIEGTDGWDGEYIVQDLMNKRWKNRIDILINPKDKPTMFEQAKLIIP